jgi:hypothetical protein
MTYFWLPNYILFIIITATTTTQVGLQTQQGTIYGTKTQNTIEYLG